ncbi:MAG: PleD family two-component system response regulator [Candidatus Binatia bacterium]
MGQLHIPRILVVQSYVNHIKSLSDHLHRLTVSLEVLSAHDAETALGVLENRAVSLLIIDAYLRGKVDGFDLCRTIRSTPANQQLPIILLVSGHLSIERFKGISAGADLLLHRPVVKEELCKMVLLLLGWSSSHATGARASKADSPSLPRLRSVNSLYC